MARMGFGAGRPTMEHHHDRARPRSSRSGQSVSCPRCGGLSQRLSSGIIAIGALSRMFGRCGGDSDPRSDRRLAVADFCDDLSNGP